MDKPADCKDSGFLACRDFSGRINWYCDQSKAGYKSAYAACYDDEDNINLTCPNGIIPVLCPIAPQLSPYGYGSLPAWTPEAQTKAKISLLAQAGLEKQCGKTFPQKIDDCVLPMLMRNGSYEDFQAMLAHSPETIISLGRKGCCNSQMKIKAGSPDEDDLRKQLDDVVGALLKEINLPGCQPSVYEFESMIINCIMPEISRSYPDFLNMAAKDKDNALRIVGDILSSCCSAIKKDNTNVWILVIIAGSAVLFFLLVLYLITRH